MLARSVQEWADGGGIRITYVGPCISSTPQSTDVDATWKIKVYCSGTLADSGSSEVTIEGGTFSNNEALELGGAIAAWGAPTVVTIAGGVFRDNAAK